MKVISNEKQIVKTVKLTKITLYASLIVLGLGFVVSIGTPNTLPNLILAVIILIIGYILFRVNSGLTVRWGNSPRPDEKLVAALKGLPSEFTLYNYTTDLPYLLLGPSGIWLFEMIDANGIIYFDEISLKWKIRKQGSFFRRMLTSDQVGDLRKSAANLQSKWEKYTLEKLKMSDIPEPTVVMILNNSETEIDGKDPQMDLIRIDKLKDQVRKRPPLTGPILAKIVDLTKILPQ